MNRIKKIVLTGILISMAAVLLRTLAITTPLLIISFSFIPIMLGAIWLGPKYSLIIAALADIIAATLMPIGPYFPGFTLDAALIGVIYGIILYKKRDEDGSIIKQEKEWKFILKLLLACILTIGIIRIFVTPIWLEMINGKGYWVILTGRLLAQTILVPVQVVSIYFIERISRPLVEKYLFKGDN